MDGLEVCRQLRAHSLDLAVLMLTARTDEVDFVVGLDAGADDYVGKPFRLAELMAGCGHCCGAAAAARTSSWRWPASVSSRPRAACSSTAPRSRWPTRSTSCCGCCSSTPARSSRATRFCVRCGRRGTTRIEDTRHAHVVAAPEDRRRGGGRRPEDRHRPRGRLPDQHRLGFAHRASPNTAVDPRRRHPHRSPAGCAADLHRLAVGGGLHAKRSAGRLDRMAAEIIVQEGASGVVEDGLDTTSLRLVVPEGGKLVVVYPTPRRALPGWTSAPRGCRRLWSSRCRWVRRVRCGWRCRPIACARCRGRPSAP